MKEVKNLKCGVTAGNLFNREWIMHLIDVALDNKDKAEFIKLTELLKREHNAAHDPQMSRNL